MIKTSIAITNLGAYSEGRLIFEWLNLPCDEEEFQAVLKQIGIDGIRYEEWFISDYECSFMEIGEYEDIHALNDLVDAVQDNPAVQAVLELEGLHYWRNNPEDLIRHAADCSLVEGVSDHEALGRYLVDNDCISVPDHLIGYFDYEAYGRDFDYNNAGGFVASGYLMV